MIDLLPAVLFFIIEGILLILWFKSRKKSDGKEKWLCFIGFIMGQIYLLWEVWSVNQTGKPSPGSIEQKMLMGRLLLGSSIGGLFTIIGLFYLSFALFTQKQDN